MPRFMVASYLPEDFDPSSVTEEMGAAIHALNDEMEAAGVLKFACGVSHPSTCKTLRKAGGKLSVTDGPYIETKEHIAGFMLLDVSDMDEALKWMRKGAGSIIGPVEIRQLFFVPDPTKEL